MSPQTVRLLHVEDCKIMRRLIAGHLGRLEEYTFAITPVESEESALQVFESMPIDLVILDYQLTEGNGLSCLRRIRKKNRRLPVVAISGTATPEIAAELLDGGADDFIGKDEMTSRNLAQSVRNALRRAAIWQQQARKADTADEVRLHEACARIVSLVSEEAAAGLVESINEVERALRNCRSGGQSLQEWSVTVAGGVAGCPAPSARGRLLRKLMHDMLLRLALPSAGAPEQVRKA